MVVPVPPLIMPKLPVISAVPRLMAPMFSSPPTLLTMPVPKEAKLVEPEGAMVKSEIPVWEATTKGLTEP